ncbi:uncharacterized protein LOC120326305 [Styela clava]
MRARCHKKLSLTEIKYLVVGTILFALGTQIGMAMWSKYVVYTSFTRRRDKTHTDIHSSNIIRTSTQRNTETTAVRTTRPINPTIGYTSNIVQWTSSEMECSFNNIPTRPPIDERRYFKALPEKFESTIWPPVRRNDCGTGRLQRPWSLDRIKNPWMIFIVKSAPHHFPQRHTVRSTWGSISSFYNKTIVVIFLLGLPSLPNKETLWQKAIDEENLVFGDILQCHVLDSYKNLPNKVLDSFQWVLKQDYRGSFYTLTDDDCMMRITNIHMYFDHLSIDEARHNIYCGFLYDRDNKAIRAEKSKWSMSAWQYSERYYPTFCHGGMYTMKQPMLKTLYCISEVTNTSGFHLEDVLITGILREKIGEGDVNIKPVTTNTGKRLDLMYYPWDDNAARTLWKMNHKWIAWNRTLSQYRYRGLLKSKPLPSRRNRLEITKLQSFWRQQWIDNFNVNPKPHVEYENRIS